VSSCKEGSYEVPQYSQNQISKLFVEFYDFKKDINPIEATKAGFLDYNDTVANYISDTYLIHLKDRYRYFLTEISKVDSTTISPSDWMSLRVMKWDCSIKLEGLENKMVTVASPIYDLPSFELMPLMQIQSLHLYIAQLAGGSSVQPFNTPKDYKNWLKRLDDYLLFLDTAIAKMQLGMDKEIVLPKILISKMLPQVEAFTDVPLEKNLFYQPVLNLPSSISKKEQEDLKEEYELMISHKLVPKYRELNRFLKDVYLPSGRTSDGLSALLNGKETYDYLIRLHTTTNLTADKIHELGLSEVE